MLCARKELTRGTSMLDMMKDGNKSVSSLTTVESL